MSKNIFDLEYIKISNNYSELDKYNFIAINVKQKTCNINFTLSNLINLSTKQDFLSNSIAEIEFVAENSVTEENSKYNEDLIIALQKLRVAPSWWNPFGKPYQSTDPAVLSDVLIAILNCPIANNNTDLINNFANNKIYNKEVLSNALTKLSLNPQSTATANNIIKIIINNNEISIYEKYQLISSYLNPNLTKEFYDDIILYVKTQNWPSDDILNLCKLLTVENSIKDQANNLKTIINDNSNENKQIILQNIIDLKLLTTSGQPNWENTINQLIHNSYKDISCLLNVKEPTLTSIINLYKELLKNELNYIKQTTPLTTSNFFSFSKSIPSVEIKKSYENQKTWLTFNSLITTIHQQYQAFDFKELDSIKPLYLSTHKKLLIRTTNIYIHNAAIDFLKQPAAINSLDEIEKNIDTWFLNSNDHDNLLKKEITDYKKNILQEINNLRTKHQKTSDASASSQQDCDSIASEIFKLLLNKNPNKSQFLIKLNNFLRPCFATGETNCSFDETKLNAIITETNYSTTIEKQNLIQVVNNLKSLLEAEKNKLDNTKKASEEIVEQTYSKLPAPITESSIEEKILKNKSDAPNKYNNLEIDLEFFLEIHNNYLKDKLTLLKQQMQLQRQKEELEQIFSYTDIIKKVNESINTTNLQDIVNSTTALINNHHITLDENKKNEISAAITKKINFFITSTTNNKQLSALHGCFLEIQNNNLLVTLKDHEDILNIRRAQARKNSARRR